MAKFCCTKPCIFKTLLVVGVIMTVCGALLIAYWTSIFENYMNQEIRIEPGSTSYPIWKDVDVPLYMEFYLFNWTNPQQIKIRGIKPAFTEMGPYVFREKREKIITKWNSENSTVTFRQNRTWEFVPSLSKGGLDDRVTTIDAVAISAAYALRNSPRLLQLALEVLMWMLETNYFVTKTSRQLIFEGYDDPLLTAARMIPDGILPLKIPFKKFAWLSERNGTADYDGIFNMYTGVKDIQKLGSIANWNYASTTGHYSSPCDQAFGTAGEIFPPKPQRTSISIFSSDFCRSLTLRYKEDIKVQGISGYRFWADKKLFASPETEPYNSCFCSKERRECWPDGIINVTTCKWGAPAFVSFPHFFHGDPKISSALEGMYPNESQHQTFIDLEKISGFPLQVNVSFQINVLLQPSQRYRFSTIYGYKPEIVLLKGMPKLIFPTLWFKQILFLDSELRDQLKLFVGFSKGGHIFSVALTTIGVGILLTLIFIYVLQASVHNFHSKDTKANQDKTA